MIKPERKMSKGRDIVDRMAFPDLQWQMPRVGAEVGRTVLSNGLVVYSLADHSLPLMSLDFRARGGYLHPERRCKRLPSVAQSLLCTGGTAEHSPEEFDELVDFHGLTLQGQARLETTALYCCGLAEKLDIALGLVTEMITRPRFDGRKLGIIKEQWREALRRRNDDPADVASREFGLMLYGDDPQGWDDNWEDINSLTEGEIRRWHGQVWDPRHGYLAVCGDFDEDRLIDTLEKAFEAWKPGLGAEFTAPRLSGQAAMGNYLVDREGTQSCICMGMLGLNRFDPQLPAAELANYIFGGGSFSSRLMDKVRTRNGMAYSIYSLADLSTLRRGRVLVSAQTKTENTQRVLSSVHDEMEEMCCKLVGEAEFQQAREALINATIMAFTDTEEALKALMQLEIIGWPSDYYHNLLNRYKEVTREEILEVSKRLFRPQDMLTVVVGDSAKLSQSCPQSAAWKRHEVGDPHC
ncbi:insulinase family protein [bacterium]|nr:insulinase family protein [bacterium]